MLILAFILTAIAAYMIVGGIVNFFGATKPSLGGAPQSRPNIVSGALFKNLSQALNRPFRDLPYFKTLQTHTQFLKLPFGALEVFTVKELLMVGGGLVAWVLVDLTWGIVAALAGFLLPDFILTSKVNARKDRILQVFPETVDILDLCIGAGLDFLSALRWVVEKSGVNPFLAELEVVLHEIQVGKSRSEALRDMSDRVKIRDVSSFSRTIIQAERMGISIEEALRNLSEDTRDSRFQRGERFAIKASLKMLIPLMLCILPVILIIVAGPVIIQFMQGDLIPKGSGIMQ